MPAPGELLAGRYRIVKPLGAGGMATVHQARDERLERDVAVKVLLPNHAGDPVLATRFEREARSLAAASHPGVVAVFDVDPGDPAAGREPFFVMELCTGGSLADRLSGGRRLPPDELIPILISVADGLSGLHARGIVHRDVKPQNILLAPDRAKLADFGLARSGGADELSELTAPGTAVGTMAYLAPEVLAGETASPAADIYALGVAAFAGLTGSLPRPASSMAELVSAGSRPAPRVSEAAPDIGPAFDEPIAAALEVNPAARPDAVSLGAGLTTALGRWSRGRFADRAAATAAASSPASARAAAAPLWSPPVEDVTTGSMAIAPATTGPGSPAEAPTASITKPTAIATPSQVPVANRPRLGAAALAALLGGALVGVALWFGVSGLLRPGAFGPSATGSPSAAPSLASPSPSVATASPSAGPTPSVFARALAAMDEVDAAIASAASGGGLKGKERNDLQHRADDVRSALQAKDLKRARDAANELQKAVEKVSDELDDAQATRLSDAVAAVRDILGRG
ncbi:MAG TPA: protein kinase [Candidatus Limnocylindrales bacterium]|nr:protein kinase [Candidatus Limnocylindrales bacterium]